MGSFELVSENLQFYHNPKNAVDLVSAVTQTFKIPLTRPTLGEKLSAFVTFSLIPDSPALLICGFNNFSQQQAIQEKMKIDAPEAAYKTLITELAITISSNSEYQFSIEVYASLP